jgi:hypothetical protein
MPENINTTTNGSANQADILASPKAKRSHRKALPIANQPSSNRSEFLLKGWISSTPKAVSSGDFPLYKPFLLKPDSDELFIKITKNSIISLSTGDKFQSNTSGYLVIL